MKQRRNLVFTSQENWRPPALTSPYGGNFGLLARTRRFFDLQTGSIWNDLVRELRSARGAVLDVGCGGQPYRELLPPGTTYIAIDHENASHFGYSMPDTIYYSGEAWPIDSETIDVVLMTETLEHVPAPCSFLREARRCLRSGGKLIITVPFAARWHFIPHDYWRFTPAGLQILLEKAGFAELRVTARGNELTVACYKVMGLILTLLMPQKGGGLTQLLRLMAVSLIPTLIVLAFVANLSLRRDTGDDCIGYTVVATAHDALPATA